jgi:hypothetical protein
VSGRPETDTSRPLGLLAGARGVFDVALDAMVWSRRSLLMAALLLLPILFALLYRFVLLAKLPAQLRGLDLYGVIVALYYVRNALPLAALFYAVSLIADEVEDKTITVPVHAPDHARLDPARKVRGLPRDHADADAAVARDHLLPAPDRARLRRRRGLRPSPVPRRGVVALTFLAYGALFTLFGVALRRPVIPGLLFLFVWELLALLPGYLPRLTLTAYLRSLILHRPPDENLAEVFGQVLPVATSLEAIAGMVVLFLGAALWIFMHKEYVLEQ